MALKNKPADLLDHIQAAERLRDSVTKGTEKIVREYHGTGYRADREPENPAPENHYYEWLSVVTASVVFDNPKVHVSSKRSGAHKFAISGMKHVLDWWASSVMLWHTLRRIFVDQSFSYGVALTTFEPMPGSRRVRMEDGRWIQARMPSCWRIAPHRWFVDPECDDYTERRFAGHMWRRDKDDLLADPKYNKEAIEAIAADADLDKWQPDQRGADQIGRDQILGYELWIPEIGDAEDDLHHGTLYTLATAQNPSNHEKFAEAKFIREPRPFFGPRSGPYQLFGTNIVPGCPYPLSEFAASYAQVQELNAHAASAASSAANFKKFVGYDAGNQAVGKVLKNVQHGSVEGIPNMGEGSAKQFELGGVSRDQYEYLQFLHERKDRTTGLSETARGSPQPDVTATAVADAASQRDSRLATIRQIFVSNTIAILRKAGWYFFHSPFAVTSLGPDAIADLVPRPDYLPAESEAGSVARKFGYNDQATQDALRWSPRILFAGGPSDRPLAQTGEEDWIVTPNSSGLMFEDMDMDIQPYSMGRVSEVVLQKRQQDKIQLLATLAPAILQFPFIKWESALGDWLQSLNIIDTEVIDNEILEQVRQGHFGQPAQPEQAPGEAAAAGGPAQGGLDEAPPAVQMANEEGQVLGQAVNVG